MMSSEIRFVLSLATAATGKPETELINMEKMTDFSF